ncbi:acyltransferase family protein [Pyxidicoccus sp. MSG2]|uniref:acyltransferase family protein n=1 Tax=Pyxidicoccus sp. MSG2 TaxID=2996790 RepID=UPI00226DFE6D|nr:acyltransferase family protein [Pyxidicoccus sp. MSG2]MCY1020951.1 acyltransferase family protein [Pyxidicoccus sp. MSG2]
MRFRDAARTSAYAPGCVKRLGPSFTFEKQPTRHPGLDGARGLAVFAMVMGHTLDALLTPAARALPWVQHYWAFRGVTAPLFLLVSGWAVVAALGTKPTAARDIYGRRVRRALLLLFLGYLLHWPGWGAVRDLGWTEQMLTHVFAFDALQCIGFALLLGSTLLALAPARWGRAGVLLALAVGIPLVSAAMWRLGAGLPGPLQQFIGSAEGSRFPFFPWAGFFFAGALAAHALHLLRPGWPQGLALLALGAGLLGLTQVLPADWNAASPWMVMYRVGQGLMVLGAVNLAPRRLSGLLAPFGRLSLWVYVLHLPVVYGWADITGLAGHIGPTLGVPAAMGVGLALLVVCTLVARAGRWVREQARPWRAGSTTLETSLGGTRVGTRG